MKTRFDFVSCREQLRESCSGETRGGRFMVVWFLGSKMRNPKKFPGSTVLGAEVGSKPDKFQQARDTLVYLCVFFEKMRSSAGRFLRLADAFF